MKRVICPMQEIAGSVLQSVVDRFAELGLTPVVASEMEFHLLSLDRDKFGVPQHTQTAT